MLQSMFNQLHINTPKGSNPLNMDCITLDTLPEGVLFFNKMEMIQDLGMVYIKSDSNNKSHLAIYKCPFCKKHFKAIVRNVKTLNTQSCGCSKGVLITKIKTKHGQSNKSIHRRWAHIKDRCYNPKDKAFKWYGGRGITICEEWKNDFISFYSWAINNGYQEGLEIDRKNNDGNYEPSNCRWTTRIININNRRLILSNNTSGYLGVSFDSSNKKYRAYIQLNGKKKYLGYHINSINAAIFRNNYITDNKLDNKLNVL